MAALESDFAKVQALVEEAVRHLSARPGTGSTVRTSSPAEMLGDDRMQVHFAASRRGVVNKTCARSKCFRHAIVTHPF